jgi:hypothetical protein
MGAPDHLLEQAAGAGISRITLIVTPGNTNANPWTCIVTRDGAIACVATGPTEEIALWEALRALGVVS